VNSPVIRVDLTQDHSPIIRSEQVLSSVPNAQDFHRIAVDTKKDAKDALSSSMK
jgi:hypothetical protein